MAVGKRDGGCNNSGSHPEKIVRRYYFDFLIKIFPANNQRKIKSASLLCHHHPPLGKRGRSRGMKERRRDWASEVGSPCGENFAPQRIRAFHSNAFHDNPELLRLVPSSKLVRKQQQKKKRRINAACSASSISFLVFSRCSRPPPMAYVDHAFSISDDDIKMESPNVDRNRPPIKEISLAVSLLVFGSLGILISAVMAVRDPRGTAEVRQPVSPTRGGWERGISWDRTSGKGRGSASGRGRRSAISSSPAGPPPWHGDPRRGCGSRGGDGGPRVINPTYFNEKVVKPK